MHEGTERPARRTRGRALRIGSVVAVLVVAALATGCSSDGDGGDAQQRTTTTAGATTSAPEESPALSAASPCGRGEKAPKRYDHVVLLLEENRTWTGGRTPGVGMGFSGGKMPFLADLASQCSWFADWVETDETQNSLNQYVGLATGVRNASTIDDCTPSATCRSTDDNIFRQVREAGGTPRSFVDGATEPCSEGSNKAKHIPALYFQGGDDADHCTEEVRPIGDLDPDHLPTFAFITPDMCHDGHDCDDATVDEWAKGTLTSILDGASYRKGKTLVVVTYDEDRPVPNLLIAPTAGNQGIDSVVASHADLLKTIEEVLGLPALDQGQLPEAKSLRAAAGI